MRTLLLGGSGQLGTAFIDQSSGIVVAPTHADFDIRTGDLGRLIAIEEPDVVVNLAAFHNVDACEDDPLAAFSVNAVAVDRLAAACVQKNVRFVTISSDYVFGGDSTRPYREQHVAQPRTAYGASKLAGECLALRRGQLVTVIRTSGIFGTTGSSNKGQTLIDRALGQAERGVSTRMVADITFSPSYAPHVARAMWEVIHAGAAGVHHVTNRGHCTWYSFVKKAFEKAGLSNAPLEAITYASLGNPTQRPMYSPLENTTFSALGIAPLPTWEDALDEFLEARRARLSSTHQ